MGRRPRRAGLAGTLAGVPDRIPVRTLIPQGGQSRVIDLRGGRRFIRRVDFTHSRPATGRGTAILALW